MHRLTVWLLTFALTACATSAGNTQRLRIGMTKEDVVAVLGKPLSMGADQQSELLYYRLTEVSLGITHMYFVRLVNDKVDSFGRMIEPQTPSVVTSPIPVPYTSPTPVP